MAVNTRILAASLAAAVVISVAGGYALSRTDNSTATSTDGADQVYTITTGVVDQGIPTNKIVSGQRLPTVSLVDTSGATVSTADLIGQPMVINIWATTCAACKQEMPALAKVSADLGGRVRFIGVNQVANTPSALAFAKDAGVGYELLSDENGALVAALGVTGLPYTIFVSANGTIVAQKGIALDQATIRSTIDSVLLS